MIRWLVLLLAAVPACAAEVVVHLDLSDSMRAGLERSEVRAVRVEIAAAHRDAHIAETKEPIAVISDIEPGTWRLRAFVLTRDATYIVDPRGEEIDVGDARADVVVPISALLVTGIVTLHGKPFHGKMQVFPWKPQRASWTLTVPLDAQGRFAFPLPWPGEWTLQAFRRLGGRPDAMGRFVFRERSAAIELDNLR